jgi:hypothetical protein
MFKAQDHNHNSSKTANCGPLVCFGCLMDDSVAATTTHHEMNEIDSRGR